VLPPLKKAILPVAIPHELRFEGTWVIAPQGLGKTALLSALLARDLHEVNEGKASIIVLDSKGELSDNLKKAEAVKDYLTLIEPSPDLSINPLDLGATGAHTTDLLEYVFSSLLDAPMTANQSTIFRAVL